MTTKARTDEPPEELPTRVLLVDDDEAVRLALGRSLRRLGCEIMEASNGDQGLVMVAEKNPAVIFLDLRMPGMDGHTFMRRLGALQTNASVVVVSGGGNMDDVVEVLRAGASDYLKKPWNPTDLMAAFARAVDRHSLKSAALHETSNDTSEHHPHQPHASGTPLEDLLARLRAGDLPVPSVPAVLASVRSLLERPDVDLAEVSARIEQDQRLAADLVRLSNTAQYARGGRNSSVRDAVSRIGFHQVHGLAETLFIQGAFETSQPRVKKCLMRVWRHSVARGLSMRALADLLSNDTRINSDTAYLVGLLADVGASLLLSIEARRGTAVDDAEEVMMLNTVRLHHEPLGAAILERWGFEAEITAPIHHHHAASPPGFHSPLWSVCIVGSALACELTGADDITAGRRPDSLLVDRCAAELQLGAPVLNRLRVPLKKEFVSFVETLGG